MDYQQAKTYALKRLQEELHESLYYHGLHHTLDVCRAVEALAFAENISEENFTLIRTATVYHDIGFVEQYQDHEIISCRIAGDSLPQFDYTPQQVEIIQNIILATRIPQNPHTHLEEILCDADLDYLGRRDFFKVADTLQKEWMAFGIISSEQEWHDRQIQFLEQHQYFTKTAREKRGHQKKKHLLTLKKLR